MLLAQIKQIEAERDALLTTEVAETAAATLLDLKTGLVLRGPCRRKRDVGAAVSSGDRM
ncbi:hypothetical protein X753_32395 [Mesorhizobium sp. LNJC399B00]|nr:hypothetical protein X753_32395 [Mesorhizobium sp. LNJC399B00]